MFSCQVVTPCIPLFYAVMAWCMLWSMGWFRNRVKDYTGQLTFHDSIRDIDGGYQRIIPTWDIPAEIRHR
jgi:hypothetical protein